MDAISIKQQADFAYQVYWLAEKAAALPSRAFQVVGWAGIALLVLLAIPLLAVGLPLLWAFVYFKAKHITSTLNSMRVQVTEANYMEIMAVHKAYNKSLKSVDLEAIRKMGWPLAPVVELWEAMERMDMNISAQLYPFKVEATPEQIQQHIERTEPMLEFWDMDDDSLDLEYFKEHKRSEIQ